MRGERGPAVEARSFGLPVVAPVQTDAQGRVKEVAPRRPAWAEAVGMLPETEELRGGAHSDAGGRAPYLPRPCRTQSSFRPRRPNRCPWERRAGASVVAARRS